MFGPGAPSRLERVIAMQTGWLGLEDPLLNTPLWVAEGNAALHAFFDSYAIAGYFDGGLFAGDDRDTMYQWSLEGAAGLDKAFRRLRYGDLVTSDFGLEDLPAWYGYHAGIARNRGLDLIVYEGGQRLISCMDERLTDFFKAIVNDPRMGELDALELDLFRAAGGGSFSLFLSSGGSSRYGHRGMLDTVYDDRFARWDAVQVYNNANPAWWETLDPPAFANGRVMLGIAGAETLTGGHGGDLIAGGAGNDTLNGRVGSDTLRVGKLDDRLSGPNGADHLHGGAGVDRMWSDVDRDTLEGGAGTDHLPGNEILAGLQDFVPVTGGFAANRPGELRVSAIDATRCLLLGNPDGNAQAEFFVPVRSAATLMAADLIL